MSELRDKLTNNVEKAIEIRFSFELPEFGDGLVELHNSLVNVQQSLTELERLLSESVRTKSEIDEKSAHLKMIWQEAFDKALTKRNTGFGSEFVTGKEKSADANLASFNEARVLRDIEQLQIFVNGAVDVIRLHYYGLDKVRQDIRKRLDMAQAEYFAA